MTTGFAAHPLGGQPVQDALTLSLVQRVVDLLADVDAKQRRHCHVDVTRRNQLGKVADEQRADQRRDVQPVGVRIGQDADLVVAQAGRSALPGSTPDGEADVADFLGCKQLALIHFPGVENLAPQRQHGLKFPVPGLLGGPAGRIALHQKHLAALRIRAAAVRELAGQDRTAVIFLRTTTLAALSGAGPPGSRARRSGRPPPCAD